jgi:uncharacterized protein
MRVLYFIIGISFFVLGFVGAFTPILPTTPFMIVALMCFSKSSPKFYNWLYYHKIFGPPIRQWEDHRVIPIYAKVLAVSIMGISQLYLYIFIELTLWIKVLSTVIISYGCWFILSKPSKVSQPD